ncbi:MAG TPA: HAMP domain-containing sensor histidine kinase [Solirubrobacterales bacterium]|jgi:signal transduction histidine kinase|nr:HAMP domain-containing sensor histidine kinase [Solirubrobacterales bacterium]
MSRESINGLKWGAAIAITSFLAGAAAVAVPHGMGAEQIILVVITAGGIALAAALAMRLAMEQRANREIEDARRRLVAAASHDLRTPLASLRLLVEAIDDGVVTGLTRDRYLREIRTHVGVLSNLVDNLFELSRIEAGDIAWTMRQIELGELIDETVAAMQAPAAKSGVRIGSELPDGGLRARANAEKVQRVLFNLLQNAIRHTPADGSVTVRARPNGSAIEVEVDDDGEGIPSTDAARVFDAFYRGAASRDDEGSGLGLAIAKAIVETHGGRIWLAPSDSGTRIRFNLPQ